MIMRDDDGQYSHIGCNACGEKSPPALVLLANHGIEAMGWSKPDATSHLCPACVAYGVRLRLVHASADA